LTDGTNPHMKTKNKYQHYLREAERAIEGAAIPSELLQILNAELETTELLVPVVGSFSAGKSSMLNSFVGRQVLPVGIRPETELAAELRFASEERIEAIALDGGMQRFGLDAFEQIRERAQDFRFLRVYINSPALQRIEPLVLVDMPGFGSAAVSHNKAIGIYLARGTHFIAAVSVEEGNITRSNQSQLQDIVEMQRDVSVVLTKANLKPESEVCDIAEYVAEQVSDLTGGEQPVHVIGSDAAALERVLTAIAPEQLFVKLFGSRLKALHFNLLENVNIALASLRRSAQENQQALDELTAAAGKVERKRDALLEDIRQRFSATGINSIVDAVGRELTAAADEMVAALQSGDKARMERVVGDILRSTLLRRMKMLTSEISAVVVHEFELELRGLDRMMGSYASDNAWSSGLSQKLLEELSKIQSNISQVGNTFDKDSKYGTVFKAAATVLAVTTNVVAPVVELLIIFLPHLLPGLFADNVREKMRAAVMTDMIPAIKEELRKELPGIVDQQLEALINQVGAQFEGVLLEKQNAIRQHEDAARADATQVAERAGKLEETQQVLTALAEKTIFEVAHG
jgi:GTP-binding protein EngB required for normal cell division